MSEANYALSVGPSMRPGEFILTDSGTVLAQGNASEINALRMIYIGAANMEADSCSDGFERFLVLEVRTDPIIH